MEFPPFKHTILLGLSWELVDDRAQHTECGREWEELLSVGTKQQMVSPAAA